MALASSSKSVETEAGYISDYSNDGLKSQASSSSSSSSAQDDGQWVEYAWDHWLYDPSIPASKPKKKVATPAPRPIRSILSDHLPLRLNDQVHQCGSAQHYHGISLPTDEMDDMASKVQEAMDRLNLSTSQTKAKRSIKTGKPKQRRRLSTPKRDVRSVGSQTADEAKPQRINSRGPLLKDITD